MPRGNRLSWRNDRAGLFRSGRPGLAIQVEGPKSEARNSLRLKKPQSFVAKYEGGERRFDVVEFITVARALDVDPFKLMTMLLSGGQGKSARVKAEHLTSLRYPKRAVQRSP